ncbi:glycosyltransferase family 4 protein [Mucilaginibacter sp. KACC 22063]|uniref:glycosyltransferase family 4 protein n=1 Tax=Mucilaginibacter sp. KACC 22063 TaxID=3025666 RepID=UPI00236536DE|nr:glycosyltransferase family 4 protein [Mucilaginibacter sp. KACC 22063]WDF54001.1 glycosyltransferase family 4 protein [Mucilaginibacter sp. KACC 22063]
MNILVVNWTWYPSGGDWTYVDFITKLYQEKGHHIVPFSMTDSRNYPTIYDKYFINKIDYKQLNRSNIIEGVNVIAKSIYSTEAKNNLKKLLSEVKIDFAHINVIHHYITPVILKVLKEHNIPIIWTLHEYTPICPESTFISHGKVCERCYGGKFYNCITHKCKKGSIAASTVAALENYVNGYLNYYKYVDHYICPSNFSYNKFKQFNFFEDKLTPLYHGYDYSEIEKVKSGNEIKSVNERYIIFVGRLEKIKGIATVLKAMVNNPDLHLKIVGTGTQEQELKTFAAQNSLKHVEFTGKKSKIETLDLINGAEFLICPSEWYEVLGFTAVEAMALQKPVIGSKMGAITEMVIDGETGYLFDPGNAEQLSEKIKSLYNKPDLIKQMGINAEKHIRKLINTERHYEGLKKLVPAL